MKVIFLDIDGVLNSWNFAKANRENDIDVFSKSILDRKALTLLKRIVDETGAEIILSSSWRKVPSLKKSAVKQLGEFGMSILSDTPYTGGIRGDDIGAWLDLHPVDSYVILDDDSDMGIHKDYLVQTNFYEDGLDDGCVEQAIKILNRK